VRDFQPLASSAVFLKEIQLFFFWVSCYFGNDVLREIVCGNHQH
jgi:hypothetical protein